MMSMNSCSERLEQMLSVLQGPAPEVAGIYTELFAEQARAEARESDKRKNSGMARPLDGCLISLKGSIDVAGYVTTAGSPLLAGRPPAVHDAELVVRLRRAGAVIVGRTQMTELAFSGLGINPKETLLCNPAAPGRVTGGSSSGAAASVAAGLADLAIGGDTGGSVRIPAALCGVTGFKPSHGRIPDTGVFPLSTTLDCVGPIAKTVQECVKAYAVLADNPEFAPPVQDGISIKVDTEFAVGDLDASIRDAFEQGLTLLARAGLDLRPVKLGRMKETLSQLDRVGVFTSPELLASLAGIGVDDISSLDPMVLQRIEASRNLAAVDYVRLTRLRNRLVDQTEEWLAPGDILAVPTVPCEPPLISSLRTLGDRVAANERLLSNTRVANLLDLPSVSVPLPSVAQPAGLMLMARRRNEARLLGAALAVEKALHRI